VAGLAQGITWTDMDHALHGTPMVGMASDGRWIVLRAIEDQQTDDLWLVDQVRPLDELELQSLMRRLRGGR
jgi:hypothetical protein